MKLKYVGEWPEITVGSGPTVRRGETGEFPGAVAAELLERDPQSWESQDAKLPGTRKKGGD